MRPLCSTPGCRLADGHTGLHSAEATALFGNRLLTGGMRIRRELGLVSKKKAMKTRPPTQHEDPTPHLRAVLPEWVMGSDRVEERVAVLEEKHGDDTEGFLRRPRLRFLWSPRAHLLYQMEATVASPPLHAVTECDDEASTVGRAGLARMGVLVEGPSACHPAGRFLFPANLPGQVLSEPSCRLGSGGPRQDGSERE